MAYSKLWRGGPYVYGVGIGINTVNQLRDNFDALRTRFLAEHAAGQPRQAPPRNSFGAHNHQSAPRCSLAVTFTSAPVGVSVAQVGASHVAWYAAYIDTGQIYLLLKGLNTYWVNAVPVQTDTTARFVDRAVYATSTDVACYLTSRVLSGGDFVPADFNYCVTVYGT